MKMQTYSVILHVVVSLLMCDYGMLSTISSLSMTTRSDIPTSNISKTTAESPTFRTNDLNITTNSNTDRVNDDVDSTSNNPAMTNDRSEMSTAINSISSRITTKGPAGNISKGSLGQNAVGVIILIFILIIIIILVVVLYFLRKKERSYSFDLTHTSGYANEYDAPLNDLEQRAPVISYEHNNKDLPVGLDYVQDDKSQENSSPIANGCAEETTEQTTALEDEDKNLPEENSFTSSPSSTPPMKKVEFNLDLDLISGELELSSLTPDDACDAAHNENNNSISRAGREGTEVIFTEINLDEPM